jgi:hypothetical protein
LSLFDCEDLLLAIEPDDSDKLPALSEILSELLEMLLELSEKEQPVTISGSARITALKPF